MKLTNIEEIISDCAHGSYDFTKNGKCSGCGQCCSNHLVMSDHEIELIRNYVKKNGIRPVNHIPAVLNCDEAEDGMCPFLDTTKKEKKCLIYKVRPKICRMYQCNNEPEWNIGNLSFFERVRSVNVRKEIFMEGEFYIDPETVDESIGFYGRDIQTTVCMEECAELIQAISKVKRGKHDLDNLAEEMADVYICLDMLQKMYRITDKHIQNYIDYKQSRTNSRIEKEKKFREFEKGAKID